MIDKVFITNITCEGLKNPLGIDNFKPRFSYEIVSNLQNIYQESYHIVVTLDNEIVWDSGIIKSNQSQNIIYDGLELLPCREYKFTVSIICNGISASGSSKFETGLLNQKIKAKWIGLVNPDLRESNSPKPITFKKIIKINKEVKKARIYATSSGLYQIYLGNKKIGDRYFAPGFTSYNHNLQYQIYDITKELKEGNNDLHIVVTPGWAVGIFGFTTASANFSKEMGLLLYMEVEYLDGTKLVLSSGKSFKVANASCFKYADFYHGETYDNNINFNDLEYEDVKIIAPFEKNNLCADFGVGVKEIKRLKPSKLILTPKNEAVFDFGQNFAGLIKLKINGIKGQKIKVRHAELLDKNGNLYTRNLRHAKAEVNYICSDGYQEYSPTFTYMGFRYASVEGLSNPSLDNLEAIVLSSDLEKTIEFNCSNHLINRLQQNIEWSSRSNFVDIPTDCPQRDERLGWTGDIAVFSRCANANLFTKRFYEKWLQDLRSEQNSEGAIGHFVPYVKCIPQTIPTAGWSDAAVFVPWNAYLAYGDKKILEDNYECMKKLVECEKKYASLDSTGNQKYIWTKPFQFGDWLAPNEAHKEWMAKAKELGTAYFANSAHIVSIVAKILGKTKDHEKYDKLFKRICKTYKEEFILNNGMIKNGYQSAYVCPLYFEMFDEKLNQKLAKWLANDVIEHNYHLTTGFLGTPFITFALCDHGYPDLSYKLLLQETFPSWLYQVKQGATTIWERWDSLRPDGFVEDFGEDINNMVSFNHYALGSVGDFLYRRIAGIEVNYLNPGYKEFKIEPKLGGNLTFANCKYHSIYGDIESNWKIEGNVFTIDVVIPCNTTAQIILPNQESYKVGSGKYQYQINL